MARTIQTGSSDSAASQRRADDTNIMGGLLGRGGDVQRLQIGLAGIAAILAMVGLANFVIDRASNEAPIGSEPEAASASIDPVTGAPTAPAAETASEPLVELGVVPDLPAESPGGAEQKVPDLPRDGMNRPPAPRQN